MPEPANYYTAHKRRFLLEFDLAARAGRSVINGYVGEDAHALIVKTRREFETLIPQLPYIGGKQPFTEFVVFTGLLLAIYRVNQTYGITVEPPGAVPPWPYFTVLKQTVG